jgi:hypothetical protein
MTPKEIRSKATRLLAEQKRIADKVSKGLRDLQFKRCKHPNTKRTNNQIGHNLKCFDCGLSGFAKLDGTPGSFVWRFI